MPIDKVSEPQIVSLTGFASGTSIGVATVQASIYQTRFYSDCFGVFQGGGCRAAGFAGAYAAAHKLGVRFSAVAGTSAGSIVASLLAAGSEPTYLLQKVRALDFESLLVPPSRRLFLGKSWFWLLRCIPYKRKLLGRIARAGKWGGLYSSEGIETWIEACLQELLGKRNRPVQFQDLITPLHVVAGDLATMKPRVWSCEATPAESVAHAVRSSCTIPLFFQPVEEGSMLLVDGGLVSNLPFFVFSMPDVKRHSRSKRTLLFTLEASREAAKPQDLEDLLQQLITLSIDGAMDVQLTLVQDLAKIAIPTGSISATDFDKMDTKAVKKLIENGSEATENFIKQELFSARSPSLEQRPIFDEHEAFLRITERLYAAKSEVIISGPNTKWFWELFPTIYYWRRTGIRVICFAPVSAEQGLEGAKEGQRRRYISGLGIQIREVATPPFTGFLIDGVGNASSSALLYTADKSDYEHFARFYSGQADAAVLLPLHNSIRNLCPDQTEIPAAALLHAADENELVNRLRTHIPFYREPKVTIGIEEVDLSDVYLISRYVRAFRYKQIGSLIDAYKSADLQLFEPAQVPLSGGDTSIVTPPVFEWSGGNFVALEGNTRTLYCANNGVTKIRAIVIKGVGVPWPGVPIPLRQVRITDSKHPPEERIQHYDRALFREIERAVRPIN
jgi:predicted acylesterase/phospholipase RssA